MNVRMVVFFSAQFFPFCVLFNQVDIVPSLLLSLQQTAPPTFCYILRWSVDSCAHLLGNGCDRNKTSGGEGDHCTAPVMMSHNDLSQGVSSTCEVFGCKSSRLSLLGRVVHTHKEVKAYQQLNLCSHSVITLPFLCLWHFMKSLVPVSTLKLCDSTVQLVYQARPFSLLVLHA